MGEGLAVTELRRSVLAPCLLALVEQQSRSGAELVAEVRQAAGAMLRSDGAVYPLLGRLCEAGWLEVTRSEGGASTGSYSLTPLGAATLAELRAVFPDIVGGAEVILASVPSTGPEGGA